MSPQDGDEEQEEAGGGLAGAVVGCLIVVLLLGVGGAGLAYLFMNTEPAVSSNGARIIRFPSMGDVHALQLEAGQLRVVSARGSVYGETATGLKRLSVNGGVASPYAPTIVGPGDVIGLAGSDFKLDTIVLGGKRSRFLVGGPGLRVAMTASDASHVALLFGDGSLQVYDGEQEVFSLSARAGRTHLAFSEGRLLIAGAGGAEVFDDAGSLRQTLSSASTFSVTAVALGPAPRPGPTEGGSWAAVARSDEKIELWRVDTGQRLCEFEAGDDFDITCLAFSADGKTLASGNARGLVQTWTLSGKEVSRFPLDRSELSDPARPGAVRSLAFDEARLVWAIEDRVYEQDVRVTYIR